ncbi:MAG: hypothetical protein QXE42_01885 [Candidatus Aenigmatarchaeota archaeon]
MTKEIKKSCGISKEKVEITKVTGINEITGGVMATPPIVSGKN